MFVYLAIPPDQSKLNDLYLQGDVRRISELLPTVPDTASCKLFFDAILDSDANSAFEKFNRFIERCPDSELAPFARERIIAYIMVAGKYSDAIKALAEFQKMYPGFEGVIDLSRISTSNDQLRTQQAATKRPQVWSVQVGAFRNRKGADATAKKVSAFGKVELVEKKGSNGNITIVKVGRFSDKHAAEDLARKVAKKTGLKPVVVVSE